MYFTRKVWVRFTKYKVIWSIKLYLHSRAIWWLFRGCKIGKISSSWIWCLEIIHNLLHRIISVILRYWHTYSYWELGCFKRRSNIRRERTLDVEDSPRHFSPTFQSRYWVVGVFKRPWERTLYVRFSPTFRSRYEYTFYDLFIL